MPPAPARRTRGRPLAVTVVGPGRVGTSLASALRRAGHRVRLTRGGPLGQPQVVLLTVPDRAVAEVAQGLVGRLEPDTVVAHTAGAFGLEPLLPLAQAGMWVGFLHPLCAVYRKRQVLQGAWAAVDGVPGAAPLLHRLARDAGLRELRRPARDQARYHLAAALAANSLAPLLALATRLMIQAGVEPTDAGPALVELMRSALQACAAMGPVAGLTGPVARGDLATVRRHLEVLEDQPGVARLYAALGLAAADLAAQRAPPPPALDAVRALLKRQG